MSTIVDQYKYEQKKINHVFHYTSNFTDLQKIVRQGFIPSYCKEEIASMNYLIPMVSFCNIPITEVDKYMRYGKNGIGMSLNWAIENGISPVIYNHDNSPYQTLLENLKLMKFQFNLDDPTTIKNENFLGIDRNDDLALDKISLTYKVNLKLLQYLKHWKTLFNREEIITYQEREWRYVPVDKNIASIIEEGNSLYNNYLDKNINPKPHLPNFPLKINTLQDIKYIVVSTEKQRENIIGTLNNKFSAKDTTSALLTGKLSILTAGQIRDDF